MFWDHLLPLGKLDHCNVDQTPELSPTPYSHTASLRRRKGRKKKRLRNWAMLRPMLTMYHPSVSVWARDGMETPAKNTGEFVIHSVGASGAGCVCSG